MAKTAKSRRPIFRESAMKQYLQRREQDILPHTVSPPFFIYAWIVLVLLVAAGAIASLTDVPTYVTTSGVITAHATPQNRDATQALVFFPATNAPKLQAGQEIQLQVGANGPTSMSKITSVVPGVISPSDARKRFALDNGAAQVITQPSIVVVVGLDQSFPAHAFAGSTVNAQLQVGTHSVLSEFHL